MYGMLQLLQQRMRLRMLWANEPATGLKGNLADLAPGPPANAGNTRDN